jgi:DNA-binding NarL/FixJ family response regulator
MDKITVILAYPQVIFREGIHFILSGEEDFEVAGETKGNQEALELIEANPPHVVVLSRADEKSDAAAVTRRIKASYPSVAVIVITGKDDAEWIFPAIVAGASALFTADTEPERMVSLIREVAAGKLPIVAEMAAPVVAARALADFKDMATLNERLGIELALLSKKESDVLAALASGADPLQVAARLGLTENIITDHLRAVLQKLTANDRTRAIIEKSQMTLPSLLHISPRGGAEEYLTREEFNEFKESLMSAFKSLFSGKL